MLMQYEYNKMQAPTRRFMITAVLTALCVVIILLYGNRNVSDDLILSAFTQKNGTEMCDNSKKFVKLIVSIDERGLSLREKFHFRGCEYSNCVFKHCLNNISLASQADALVFSPNSTQLSLLQKLPASVRQRQLWFVFSEESPAYLHNRFNKIINSFNGSITYSLDSVPAQFPYGYTIKEAANYSADINYAQNKTKGAYAYVSNCNSRQYNRLDYMRKLAEYIDVDIFGECTNHQPCPKKNDPKCEAKMHSQYRFYLAFENSLCKEYITEKFWKTLKNEKNIIPVALGGLSVQEYTDVAPPDSFIHAYNFSSVETLGKYLQYLMTDDNAYNRYFAWRHNYKVTRKTNMQSVCKLCESINHPETLKSAQNQPFADMWNSKQNCKNL